MVTWLPVVGYEGSYEVSDEGVVRSLDRTTICRDGRRLFFEGKELLSYRTPPMGYRAVKLSKEGVKRSKRIHTIVLEAFVGPRPDGMVACHSNGIQDDLRLANLRWDTQTSNNLDAVAHGTHHNGSKTHCKRGHEFTAANTYLNPSSGGRQCRQCDRDNRGIRNPYGPRKSQLRK